MSDAGEGLIDAESRIQERMEEVMQERTRRASADKGIPEQVRALESLRLARIELERQFAATAHQQRRAQLTQAIEEVNRRIAAAKTAN
jgi:hypothetical protein